MIFPIAYPLQFRETLIVDVYTRQSDLVGQRNNTGMEVGLRHQLSSRIVVDAGVGTEFYGPSDRPAATGPSVFLLASNPCPKTYEQCKTMALHCGYDIRQGDEAFPRQSPS